MIFSISFLVTLIAIIIFFKLAARFSIVDTPNERSSHTEITYRGAGIIFLIGPVIYYLDSNQHLMFFCGMILVSVVSFIDDLKDLPSYFRFIVQTVAVLFLFYDLHIFMIPWFYIPLALIFTVGVINAYNFMDGINGITALYSITVLLGCYFAFDILNANCSLPIAMLAPLMIFSFYNVRKKALCFAGDVGAVCMAFAVIYMIIWLLYKSLKYEIILFLVVYGIDSAMTIAQRLLEKENILKPHRKHLYQYLVHTAQMSHLRVSYLYATVQMVITGLVLLNLSYGFFNDVYFTVITVFVLLLAYYQIKKPLIAKSAN